MRKMNYKIRFPSTIVLLLLWVLCNGESDSGGGGGGRTHLSNTGRNDTVSQFKQNLSFATTYSSAATTSTTTLLQSQRHSIFSTTLSPAFTTSPPLSGESHAEQRSSPNHQAGIKTTSRSKLWSPYSTMVNLVMDENDDGPSSLSSSKVGESVSQSDHRNPPPSLPLVSSIRHFRSRKSFVRIKKPDEVVIVSGTIHAKKNNEKNDQAHAQKPVGQQVPDLHGEQADEPFISNLNAQHGSESGGAGINYYGSVVKEKAAGAGKAHRSESPGGSTKIKEEVVYGKPYFISTTRGREEGEGIMRGNASSKRLQRIDKFLSQQSQINGSSTNKNAKSNDDGHHDDGAAGPPVPEQLQRSKSESEAKYGVAIIQPQLNFNDEGHFHTMAMNGDAPGNDQHQFVKGTPVPPSTKKPRGGRNKTRGDGGERKRKKAEGQDNTQRDKSSSKANRKRGKEDEFGEKQRLSSSSSSSSSRPIGPYNPIYNPEDRIGINNDGNNFLDGSSNSRESPNYFPHATEFGESGGSGDGEEDERIGRYNNNGRNSNNNPDESINLSDQIINSGGKPGSIDIVTEFLQMVDFESKRGANCTKGSGVNLGEGVVDRYAQERFRLQAELTVNRANMLTRFWKYANPKTLDDEYILRAMVISLIEFDGDIFAAGNCYDENQYKNYTLFCPYGYREQNGSIHIKDLSLEYQYLSNSSEWFWKARKDAERIIKNFNQFSRGYHSYLINENETVFEEDDILNVTYEDGKWSKPYFDCGGGNIWMITYMIPFFGWNNGTYYFKGTSGIDIDLRRVDIDQCPLPDNSTELNIFAASDKCKKSTTKCVAIKGLGFRRGSYKCECQTGFYFPNISSLQKYYNGTQLEEEYEKKFSGLFFENETTLYDTEGVFECLRCPDGCDTCVDDRPCVVSLNWVLRTGILTLQGGIIAILPFVGLFTWKYSNVKVVRAASPVLLRFIVLGAFFIYCTILVMYPSPNVITCTMRVWLREIGFSLAYGALMLKTWRISVIFRVRSAKAIKITDLDLMKRLGIIVLVFTALLVIRTLVAPPVAIVSYTADELKAWLCKTDWWDHSFTIMELSFLVWGIRLCIVVRKAPSEFNESKYISLAIYNEFLLSLFLNISMLFLQSPANPDLLYSIFFGHVQFTITLLLGFIFGSKAYIVFRGNGKGGGDEPRVPTSKFISKSRSGQTMKQTSGYNSTGPPSSSTSTDPNVNARLSEDVQEEFRRLYFQLEELKERNMRLGNRHLVAKITAMQEAADNILSTAAQINGQQDGSSIIKSCKSISGPGLLSDISEEEPSPLPHETFTGEEFPLQQIRTRLPPDKLNLKERENGKGKGEDEKGQGPHEEQGQDKPKPRKKEKVQFENLELKDTNLDEVDFEMEDETRNIGEEKVKEDSRSDINPDCISDVGGEKEKGDGGKCENIPTSVLRKRKHKHQQSSPNPSPQKTQNSSSEVGKKDKSNGGGEESSKPQNHAGGASTASGSKLVIDLDDKSRFTEEITV